MRRCVACLLGVWMVLSCPPCSAEDFYRGKTITLIASGGTSGLYAEISRVFLRYFPEHLPGRPGTVFTNMPGAGNVIAANHMYNIAPKDGTVIAIINNAIPLHQVLDGRGVRYDAARFGWLGSTGALNSVMYVWHSAGIRTIEQAKQKEVVLGGTGAGSDIVIYPTVMNKLLGTKFNVVLGYKTIGEIDIAVERGELQGRMGSYRGFVTEHPDWVREGKLDFIIQIGTKDDPVLPGVPLAMNLASSKEDRDVLKLISSPIAIGRPYLAPPDLPPDRLALLRQAFAATMSDDRFLAEATRFNADLSFISGEEIAETVREIVAAPPGIVAKAKAAMELPEPRAVDRPAAE